MAELRSGFQASRLSEKRHPSRGVVGTRGSTSCNACGFRSGKRTQELVTKGCSESIEEGNWRVDTFQIRKFRAQVLHSVTPARAAGSKSSASFSPEEIRWKEVAAPSSSHASQRVCRKAAFAPKRARLQSRNANAKGSRFRKGRQAVSQNARLSTRQKAPRRFLIRKRSGVASPTRERSTQLDSRWCSCVISCCRNRLQRRSPKKLGVLFRPQGSIESSAQAGTSSRNGLSSSPQGAGRRSNSSEGRRLVGPPRQSGWDRRSQRDGSSPKERHSLREEVWLSLCRPTEGVSDRGKVGLFTKACWKRSWSSGSRK